jgi:cell filamentation protein
LDLTDKSEINEYEAAGLIEAEFYILELDSEEAVSIKLILDIHRIAFEKLYDWAGGWRSLEVIVGQFVPTSPVNIIQSMYQFVDNLNYKVKIANTDLLKLECLVFAHYEFVKIPPFNNGNGRTGRLLMSQSNCNEIRVSTTHFISQNRRKQERLH